MIFDYSRASGRLFFNKLRAEVLRISPQTVRRDWEFAKAWLIRELSR